MRDLMASDSRIIDIIYYITNISFNTADVSIDLRGNLYMVLSMRGYNYG